MNRVVMFSGGLGSWACAKRVAARHGTAGLTLLFADTLVEDPDLYRFLGEAAADVGAPLVRVTDGRTPWGVFRDARFLGNTRVAHCSRALKVEPCRRWLAENRDPADTTVYVGIDWSECHRLPAIVAGWHPYRAEAPLTEAPYLTPGRVRESLAAAGLRAPAAYGDGFPHNNCLAQGCVKGGQAYWRRLLECRPAAYAASEREEEALRSHLGKDVAVLRDRRGGRTVPLTLRVFRERAEAGGGCDLLEWGGCGCFTDAD